MTTEADCGYRPISDYAVIGDTQTVALVSIRGSIDWCCFPEIGGPPLLAGILDRQSGGCFFLGGDAEAEASRRYLDEGPVLQTRFEAPEGTLVVTDFMHLRIGGLKGRLEPEREVVRIVEAIEGEPVVRLSFQPRNGYGNHAKLAERRGVGWVLQDGADLFQFRTDVKNRQRVTGEVVGGERLSAGEKRYASLSFCRRDIGIIPALGQESEEKKETTTSWWRQWGSQMAYDGPFRAEVERSLCTLRLLTNSQTGAVAAAATTSLPEWIGASRNWDYRFCWMRDAYLVLAAFMRAGMAAEAEGYFRWLMHATQLDTPELKPVYDVYGRSTPDERIAENLEGYCISAPVRFGNAAAGQLQLDGYGSVILAACDLVRGGGRMGASEASRLRQFGQTVCRQWNLPDNGIWEMRNGRMHHCYSKAMCWAALAGLLWLNDQGVVDCERAQLEKVRDAIKDAIFREGWNEARGAFTGAFGADHLDASVLLLPKLGLIRADDPRMIATFEKIDQELSDGPFVWRYPPELDGSGSPEGSFVACGFWAAEYLALRGDREAATRRIVLLMEAANDLLLFSEEYDPKSGTMLGNLPQGLSHAALVHAALAVEQGMGERNYLA